MDSTLLAALVMTLTVKMTSAAGEVVEEECPCFLFPDVKDTYTCADPSLTFVPSCIPDSIIYLGITSPIPLVRDSVSRFTNLTELHVMSRNVDYVAADFVWSNGNLVILEFFFTGLEYVNKDWFLGAPQIKAVSFDYNRLASLPEDTFRFLPEMTDLFLRHNNLTSLSTAHFENSPRLGYVYLGDNPWHCDCGLATFVQWTRDRKVQMPGSPSCSTPEHLAGVYLKDLSQEQLCPVRLN